MSRKRHGGVLGDLFEIAALLPWWLEAGLALAAYVVFHSIATADIQAATLPAQVGVTSLGNPWQSLAAYFQYILPLVLLVGALASAIADDRRRASEEARGAAPRPAADGPAAEPDR